MFEVITQTSEHPVQLFQRHRNPLVLFETSDTLSFTRSRVSHQNPAWTRLAPRRLPDLDRATRERETVKFLLLPETIFGLQVDARNCVVVRALDHFELAR